MKSLLLRSIPARLKSAWEDNGFTWVMGFLTVLVVIIGVIIGLPMWYRGIMGFAISLGAGQLGVFILLWWVRRHLGEENDPLPRSPIIREVPPEWIGLIERTFFTLIIAFNVSGAGVSMIAWIMVKMFSTWNRLLKIEDLWAGPFAFSSLLGNLVSMLFALVGGLICRKGNWEIIIQWLSFYG